jgi:hypothetical protein
MALVRCAGRHRQLLCGEGSAQGNGDLNETGFYWIEDDVLSNRPLAQPGTSPLSDRSSPFGGIPYLWDSASSVIPRTMFLLGNILIVNTIARQRGNTG